MNSNDRFLIEKYAFLKLGIAWIDLKENDYKVIENTSAFRWHIVGIRFKVLIDEIAKPFRKLLNKFFK